MRLWSRMQDMGSQRVHTRQALRSIVIIVIICAIGFMVWLALPVGSLFPGDYSTLVFDSRGRLLRATLSGDQQFRFPPDGRALPHKYVTALVANEDRRFFRHPGVDPLAVAKAAYTNIKAGRRIRGGSTITMQVARLSDPKARSYRNKLRECLVALKLSCHFSKEEILSIYARNAPMGGNVVGIEAAAHLYFGKPADELTWAEASLIAVLPNDPSMINLERDRPRLRAKRDHLLGRLREAGIIDSFTCRMACAEPLPGRSPHLPFEAPHFTTMVLGRTRDSYRITTTLDGDIQHRVTDAVRLHADVLSNQGIENLAVLVAETASGEIRAYVGSHDFYDDEHGGQVDGVTAYRSTGSLLKPFLVAKALERGPFTIATKIQDVPTYYGTFAPQNASRDFSGLVGIDRILIESLNVPSVRLLNAYGLRDFYDFLVEAGLHGLFRSPMRYGLPLVIGGAEASLHELVRLYRALGNLGEPGALRAVEHVTGAPGRRNEHPGSAGVNAMIGDSGMHARGARLFSEGAAWLVLDVLRRLSRPGVEFYWDCFNDQVPVAWKTGTSYGQKDGWAIGVNRQWTIGVWTGNFTGEGNAALGGSRSAAPLLFTLFNMLTLRDRPIWFDEPHHALKEVACCVESGYPAGPYCPETITVKCPRRQRRPGTCPYHRRYLVDAETGGSVCSLCWDGIRTRWDTLFIAPPAVREILAGSGRHVDAVPHHAAHCPAAGDERRIELVYPVEGVKIFVPRDFDGEHERIVFSAKHQRPPEHLFWYLNGSLIGETVEHHELPIELESGSYRLTVQDEEGFKRTVEFNAYRKET